MKLISWNVNGIRSVSGKGFGEWMKKTKPDILCVQEIKAFREQLEPELHSPPGYFSYWASAEKPGYSGCAVFTKVEPLRVEVGMGWQPGDSEGRVLQVEYEDFLLLNAYFPNSQRDHARLDYKLEFCRRMHSFIKEASKKKPVVLCGDFNVAHREIDLKNPKSNAKTAGFLPEERAWMESFLADGTMIDAFRHFNPEPGHYTWWSYRPGVREKNIGWRIDYFCVSAGLKARLKHAAHLPEVMGSDHCPVVLELKPR